MVATASLARPSRHGITVNAVYVPPRFRRRGYATSLASAVSAEGLARGRKFCLLYVDSANPTAGSIYRKVGYRPGGESRFYRFGGAA